MPCNVWGPTTAAFVESFQSIFLRPAPGQNRGAGPGTKLRGLCVRRIPLPNYSKPHIKEKPDAGKTKSYSLSFGIPTFFLVPSIREKTLLISLATTRTPSAPSGGRSLPDAHVSSFSENTFAAHGFYKQNKPSSVQKPATTEGHNPKLADRRSRDIHLDTLCESSIRFCLLL